MSNEDCSPYILTHCIFEFPNLKFFAPSAILGNVANDLDVLFSLIFSIEAWEILPTNEEISY